MKKKIDWCKAYQLLESVTPLIEDCGQLCRKKCCSLEESGQGVYLFSGEGELFETESDWYQLKQCANDMAHYTGKKPLMLDCYGECPRDNRPLVCRLFPMAPYINPEGTLDIIFDPDAYFICPLARLKDHKRLDKLFRERVRQVWMLLLEDEDIKENVKEYSRRLDMEAQDPWKKLLGTDTIP